MSVSQFADLTAHIEMSVEICHVFAVYTRVVMYESMLCFFLLLENYIGYYVKYVFIKAK